LYCRSNGDRSNVSYCRTAWAEKLEQGGGKRLSRSPSRLWLPSILRTIRLLRRVLLRPVLLSSVSVLLRSCSLLRIERQLLVWVLSSEGDRHVSRHNPYHYPHSCLARRLSNLGPQQRLGVWAFWNCRPHSHRGHHLGSAGSAVISFSEAQLSAAGFQAYRAEG